MSLKGWLSHALMPLLTLNADRIDIRRHTLIIDAAALSPS
jgi:hypothetical protein